MKRRLLYILFIYFAILSSCTKDNKVPNNPSDSKDGYADVTASPKTWDGTQRAGITYQLLVYSFADSDGDGIGDFKGIISKLDYLKSLGVNALWLSPIHPAMSYHGYDVTDYDSVNPKYGSMTDFESLIAAAHSKGIKIYLDYVLNHTGVDHPWFKAACASSDNPYRDYYSFSSDPQSDISAGRIPMISTEGASGYVSSEWQVAPSGQSGSARYRFSLDWSNASTPTVTVEKTTDSVDPVNPDVSTTGAKYLYFGDAEIKKFYDKGNGKYSLVVDYSSTWGFLIRTSSTEWNGYKYGASSASSSVTLGKAFQLYKSDNASDIRIGLVNYFHSNFSTSWFADLNYGPVSTSEQSAAFLAMAGSAKKWVEKGVDGFRLDAVKHIYHNQTSSENPTFLKKFYDSVNTTFKARNGKDIYMVGEAFSEAAQVAPYYKGLPAMFEFSFWHRLQWALQNGTGCYFCKDIMSYEALYAVQRSDFIEATKLSNHDEDRTASVLDENPSLCKQAAAILLTAPGKPYIYYGEELGYYGTGSSGDEYRRAPMYWGEGNVATYTDKIDKTMQSSVGTVARQSADANSILSTYRQFAQARNTYPALASGTMSAHSIYNDRNTAYKQIAAWYMTSGSDKMLVIHNLAKTETIISITDAIKSAVVVLGTVSMKKSDSSTYLKLGANSSVVFEL